MGKFIYLFHTQQDIDFSIDVVNQSMNNPREEHLEAVYCILGSIKMTPVKRLLFNKSDNMDINI